MPFQAPQEHKNLLVIVARPFQARLCKPEGLPYEKNNKPQTKGGGYETYNLGGTGVGVNKIVVKVRR